MGRWLSQDCFNKNSDIIKMLSYANSQVRTRRRNDVCCQLKKSRLPLKIWCLRLYIIKPFWQCLSCNINEFKKVKTSLQQPFFKIHVDHSLKYTLTMVSELTPFRSWHSFLQLPLSLLTEAQGHPMLVELKNGETLNGSLSACDTYMNLTLRECVQTSAEGDKFWKLPEVYVRGNNVGFDRPHRDNVS